MSMRTSYIALLAVCTLLTLIAGVPMARIAFELPAQEVYDYTPAVYLAAMLVNSHYQTYQDGWHGTYKDAASLPEAPMTNEGNLGASASAFTNSGVKCWSGTLQNPAPFSWTGEHCRWAMQSTTFHMATTTNRYAYTQLWCSLRGLLRAFRLPIIDVNCMSNGFPTTQESTPTPEGVQIVGDASQSTLEAHPDQASYRAWFVLLESDTAGAPDVYTYGDWGNLREHTYEGYTVLWDSSTDQGPDTLGWHGDVDTESWPIGVWAVPNQQTWGQYGPTHPCLKPGKYYTFALCLEVSTMLFGSGGSTYADFCSTIQTWPWGIIGGYAESGFATPAALIRMSVTP